MSNTHIQRTFVIRIRIERTLYTRTVASQTPDTATAETMAALWDATGTKPQQMTLLPVKEITRHAKVTIQ